MTPASATPAPPQVSTGRLPVTSPDLFGRDNELAWLDRCWNEGVHVATLVAWGGVGKSALVNKWLARLRDDGWRGADKVFGWSFYSQGTDRLSSSDEFIDAALHWFGDKDPSAGSSWDKGERLASLVRKQRTILILDGVEPLQWGPGVEQGKLKDPALEALVKELGARNKGLCVVTSRIHMTDLEALAGDKVQKQALDHLSVEAGAELLKARGAKGSEEELQAAAKEYDGHSFALTLLGTYIRNAHKGDIRKRDLIPPLAGKPAHRMMAIYEHWFENKSELAILRMLGLFDRPAPEDEIAVLRAAPVITSLTDTLVGLPKSAWNEAVTALRDVGLLAGGSETEEAERLDAHPLVREHFGEQLKRHQPEAWREGHRRLYEHLKRKAKELPDTIEEMAPLYAAVVHGCLAGKNQEALYDVWGERIRRKEEAFSIHKLGAFGSEVAVLSAFFDPPWERLAAGLTEPNQALILNEAGFALRALGRLREAAGLMRLSLDKCIEQENWKEAAIRASNLSELLQSLGKLREAVEQARKSVELADKSGDAFWRTVTRTKLAAAQHAMGLREEAAAQFEEAERMQRETYPATPVLTSLRGFQYCNLLLDQGRDADVRERAAEALRWEGGRLLAIALDHLALGRAHLLGAQRGTGGDQAQAASHLAASVDGLRRAGQQDDLPLGLLARAALHTHTGAFGPAHKDLDEALTLATRCGMRLHEADAHLGHARLCLAEGAPAAARSHLERARKLIEETGYHRRDEDLAELEAEAAQMAKAAPAPAQDLPSVPVYARQEESPKPMPTTPPAFDVAIVCALRRPELEKVLATGKQPWTKLPPDAGELTAYRTTTFERARGPALSVVAAAPSQMGMPASATLAAKMVQRFRPKLVAMVGIAGGVDRATQGFGDILAPATTFDYGAGKLSVKGGTLHLHPDSNPINIVPILRERLEEWVLEEERLLAIRRQWSGPKPNTVLKLHVGPLGSGAAVVAARETVEATQEHWRKLIGIEMEAYGVHHACQGVVHPAPMFLCMKSICDFAGPDKNDSFQDYAAFTAAQLFHLFLTEEWDTLFPP